MKILAERIELDCSAKHLWSILSDVGRCDWVPTIEKITLDGDCRFFEMAGMGTITEKILLKDNEQMILQGVRKASVFNTSVVNVDNQTLVPGMALMVRPLDDCPPGACRRYMGLFGKLLGELRP